MSISQYQFDPYFAKNVDKNLVPSLGKIVGRDNTLKYYLYEKLIGLREILKSESEF